MTLPLFFFYVFSIIAVASALMVIASRNPVHSVLFLILCFVNAAGLFMLAGAEFLALILIVVYVGAVAVLFLFVIMMLDVDFASMRQGMLQYAPIGVVVGLILLLELLLVAGSFVMAPTGDGDGGGADRSRGRQYAGARPGALHALRLPVPGRRRRCCWSP